MQSSDEKHLAVILTVCLNNFTKIFWTEAMLENVLIRSVKKKNSFPPASRNRWTILRHFRMGSSSRFPK